MERPNMLARLKKRLGSNGPGMTIAVIALIVALTGGAYAAAKGGLTQLQKKQVKKIAASEAKKFANSNPGSPGTAGAQGPKGDQGPAGKEGAAGKDGVDGEDGKSINVTTVPTGDLICNELGGAVVKEEGNPSGAEVCNGASGQDAGFNYLFSTDTGETDPGAGHLKLDNAAPGSATLLRISETDNNANPLEKVIRTWLTSASTKGTLLIRKVGTPTTFAQYTIRGGIACTTTQQTNNSDQCGMADEGTFEKIRVSFVEGNGTFANEDSVTIAYFSTGSATLPSGAVETGAWAFTGTTADTNKIRVPLSFSVPLFAPIEGAGNVHFTGEATFSTFCKGTVGVPAPISGHICVYANSFEPESPVAGTTFEGIYKPATPGVGGEGADRQGAVLVFSSPTKDASGAGIWAVRAP